MHVVLGSPKLDVYHKLFGRAGGQAGIARYALQCRAAEGKGEGEGEARHASPHPRLHSRGGACDVPRESCHIGHQLRGEAAGRSAADPL